MRAARSGSRSSAVTEMASVAPMTAMDTLGAAPISARTAWRTGSLSRTTTSLRTDRAGSGRTVRFWSNSESVVRGCNSSRADEA